MLAKVIKLRNERGGRVSSRRGVEYILRDGGREHTLERPVAGGSFNLEMGDLDMSDPQDWALASQMMDYTAEAGRVRNRFTSNPFYHYVLSWREGEHPSPEQCREAVAHTLKGLGMAENQAVWGLHTDQDHHWHIHILANRVHPERLHLSGPPRFDYLVLDRACRELEMAQGWAHDLGPHAVIDGAIRRLSKGQRQQLGLVGNKPHAPTPGARAAEVNHGVPSLSDWLRARAQADLLNAKSWGELHQALAERGCSLRLAGGGLVIDTKLPDGRGTSTKASGVHYSLSLGRLEKRLGPFLAPASPLPDAAPARTYARYIENVRAGTEPGLQEIPGRTGDTPERSAKRQARALARKELADAFKREQESQKTSKKALTAGLRAHHADEKAALRNELKTIKPARIAQLTAEHGSKQVAQGLWAAEAVVRKQELQQRQRAERMSLTRDAQRMDWPEWLEKQAALGDEAAAAALRGIKYREGRGRSKGKNGFEGEDLDPLHPATGAVGGAIGGSQQDTTTGARKVFALEDARIKIDRCNQRIEYHDAAGQVRMTDSGQRVDVHVPDADTIEAGLLLASQKFGGEVFITGEAEFRERAARQAARLGVQVKDEDLQQVIEQERAQIEVERTPSRPRRAPEDRQQER
jgi:hypothetical protein